MRLPTIMRVASGPRVASSGLRSLLGLFLALTFMPWTLWAPAPVHAADYRTADPEIRLQVIVKDAVIYDDNDPLAGDGEFQLFVELHRCPAWPAPCVYDKGTKILTRYTRTFNSGTKEPAKLFWITPRATDPTWEGYDLSEDAGYPLYSDERYLLQFSLWERDSYDNDDMGSFQLELGPDNQWLLGSHQDKGSSGDYMLDYEIRMTQLPNLMPTSIDPLAVPGSSDVLICVGLLNTGPVDAGPFRVTLRVDGKIPLRNGQIEAGRLGSVETGQLCGLTDPPETGGAHTWTATVDEARQVAEMSESDNRFEKPLTLKPKTAAPTVPAPSPPAGQPDLTVSAIRVRGQVPDGKDDCKKGGNDVTVVVKNGGTARAGDFAVRLVVDGDAGAAKEELVGDGLDAGTSYEVHFGAVRLREGEHSLLASADPNKAITESKDDNNELKITARCKGD